MPSLLAVTHLWLVLKDNDFLAPALVKDGRHYPSPLNSGLAPNNLISFSDKQNLV